MAINSNTVQTNAAFKTLFGKGLTDADNKGIGNESEGAFISVPSKKVFVENIDADPSQAVTDGVAQLVNAELQPDPTSNGHAFVTVLSATIGAGVGVLETGKKYYCTAVSVHEGVTYNEGDSFLATSEDLTSGTVKERVENIIDPKYGVGYEAKPKIGATAIPVDDPKLWIFQYDNGIFFQEVVTGGTPTAIDVYQYVGSTLLDANVGLTVSEIDTNPILENVKEIRFNNGSVTDLGNGIVEVDITSPSSLTVEEADASPSVLEVTKIIFPDGTVSDLGGGEVAITFGAGTMSSFDIAGDLGANETVTDGQILSILGNADIETEIVATDTVNISLKPTTVISGTYGDSSNVPQFIVDVNGRVTAVSNVQIDHDALLNYNINEHRAINDTSTLTTELFSASKILSLFTAATNNADVKDSVQTVTSSNEILSGVGQTIEGHVVVAGDRIGVVNQTAFVENGIYVASAGSWSRSTDADNDSEVTNGMTFFVSKGNKAGNQYIVINGDPITVGIDPIVFTEVPRIVLGTTSGTAAEGNDPRIPTQDENDALVGTGVPSSTNVFVTEDTLAAIKEVVDRDTSVATSGNESPTGVTISSTPLNDGNIMVFVGTNPIEVGGDKTKDGYFSNDGGTTARAIADITAGDEFIWNGVIAGVELDTLDEIIINYII